MNATQYPEILMEQWKIRLNEVKNNGHNVISLFNKSIRIKKSILTNVYEKFTFKRPNLFDIILAIFSWYTETSKATSQINVLACRSYERS